MDGFVFFIFIIIFIIFPIISKKKKSAGSVSDRAKALRQKIEQAQQRQANSQKKGNPFGNARSNTHKDLHNNDSSSAFPDTHAGRVSAREQRDRVSRAAMKVGMKSGKNRGVIRAENKGRDDWGRRGDKGFSQPRNFFTLFLLLILAWAVIGKIAPGIFDGLKF